MENEVKTVVSEIMREYPTNEQVTAGILGNSRAVVDRLDLIRKDLHSVKNMLTFFTVIAVIALIVAVLF